METTNVLCVVSVGGAAALLLQLLWAGAQASPKTLWVRVVATTAILLVTTMAATTQLAGLRNVNTNHQQGTGYVFSSTNAQQVTNPQ